MKIHRLAKYFPLLEGEEFELLKQDIKDNGQLEPIVTFNGEILDGVNRYRAIQELNKSGESVEPDFVPLEGDGSPWSNDPLKYVISANVRRRHLTEGQRSMISQEMKSEYANKAKQRMSEGGRTKVSSTEEPFHVDKELAKEFGVSKASVYRAGRVKEQAPERVPDIIAGKTTLRQVDTELREAAARERAEAKHEKKKTKKREERKHEVKEYLFALRAYDDAVMKAIDAAYYGKFSPEAARHTRNRHSKLRNVLIGFDQTLEEIGNG